MGGLEPFDITLPHVLAHAGIHSHIETDHYHYFQGGGEFYATTFSTWEAYRGQEYDPMPAMIRPGDSLDTDHGLMFGERGHLGKNACHAWNELARIPLFVHLPGSTNAGERRSQLSQNIDIFPTLLDFFGSKADHAIHGRSYLDIAEHDSRQKHEAVIFGCYGKTVTVTDREYVYMRGPATPDNVPLYHYFLMPTEYHHRMKADRLKDAEFGYFLPYIDIPVLRAPGIPEFAIHTEIFENRRFNIADDYQQRHNLYGTTAEKRMREMLVTALKAADCPQEQFERLGLIDIGQVCLAPPG